MRFVPLAVILILPALPPSALSQAGQETVPFVGCPADGQVGPAEPPQGPRKVAVGESAIVSQLAFYKGEYSPGVFAPRGWRCKVWYGSSGSILLVAPDSTVIASFQPRLHGPAVELQVSVGGTSGRFTVAAYGSRLFPSVLANFINAVRSESLSADSEFAPKRFSLDSVRSLTKHLASFTTPATSRGLGTGGFLEPSENPIRGLAVLTDDPSEPDLSVLRVRLRSTDPRLQAAILQLNRACLQRTGGC